MKRNTKTKFRILMIGVLICAFSCAQKEAKEAKETDVMEKIVQLAQFKKTEKRIDSLKKAGIEVELQVSMIKDSFYPEDSSKNLSIVMIEEDYGFDKITLYQVKFNKLTQEIVSIDSL